MTKEAEYSGGEAVAAEIGALGMKAVLSKRPAFVFPNKISKSRCAQAEASERWHLLYLAVVRRSAARRRRGNIENEELALEALVASAAFDAIIGTSMCDRLGIRS